LYTAAKKVSAAPHRGNANTPLTNQGKAKGPKDQPQTNHQQGNTKKPTQRNRRAGQNPNPAPSKKKSHYMNPTLTYWRFSKNRPTIQPTRFVSQKKTATTIDSKKKTGDKPPHAQDPKAAPACPRHRQPALCREQNCEQNRPPLRSRAVSAKNHRKANRHE
ncbi:hypothetical protein PQR68_05710, partial [Paraburkholderia agricolaris]|uniref:hypothetical protein n=1 Tax=Paraburkholderia agricolaris TaxID=2152888 RepID=UPI0038BC3FC6